MEQKEFRLKMGLAPKSVNVDKENRMLNGVVAIEPMDIKDYRAFSINEEFITDLVALGKKQKDGVKSYFGHNWDNEGKLLGRAINWREEEGKAKYDLVIHKAADNSPTLPNVGKYLLDLMEEDDNAMMNSIVFQPEYFYQFADTGKKVKCYEYSKDGDYIYPNPELGKVYPKIGTLMSTDIVSEGAATNSMFKSQPEEKSWLHSIAEKVKNFILEKDTTEFILSQKEVEEMTEIKDAVTALTAKIDALVTALSQKPADTPPAAPETPAAPQEDEKFKALEQKVELLTAQLAAQPAADPTTVNDGEEGAQKLEKQPWVDSCPMTQEAAKYLSKFEN